MNEIIHQLPGIMLLGAVVATFASLYRNHRTPRTRLWFIAWILLFLRAVLQAFGPKWGMRYSIENAFDLVTLQLAGLFFFLSLTKMFEVPRLRLPLLLTISTPAVIYGALFGASIPGKWIYIFLAIALLAISCAWFYSFFGLRIYGYSLVILITIMVTAVFAIIQIAKGRIDIGYYAGESLSFAFASLLFWRSYKRLSPGVLLTLAGFLACAVIFPAFYFVHDIRYVAALIVIASVPKIIIALGMIVTLLEEESLSAKAAREQERSTRRQLQRFFDVTSQLLSGVEVPGICNHIAQVIIETSNFQRTVILLSNDQRTMHVAGSAGIDPATLGRIQEGVSKHPVDVVTQFCLPEKRIGLNSFRSTTEKLRPYGAQPSTLHYDPNNFWREGDEILVPLRSSRGVLLGCISLDDPRQMDRVNAEELSAVELLAADLAVSIENANLQKQLVRSEKLAGIGQLVSGAAHELNNPLTAVLGYTEMLADSAHDEAVRRDLGVIRREALRMKQIIENLLRFARQTKFERKAQSLAAVLDDVLKLRNYDLRNLGIELTTKVSPDLPGVMVEENLLKQVFLNILNNALDAMSDLSQKKLTIEASALNGRVQLRFTDNGPGFSDLDRVFDPFFTTKSPGKGTGLGLSICYGIIKEHGGEITAFNLQPHGACVLIELPAGESPNQQENQVTPASVS